MDTFIIYAALAICCLIVFGLSFGYYQANLYLNENKLFLLLSIICLAASGALFYYAFQEYKDAAIEKDKIESRRDMIHNAK